MKSQKWSKTKRPDLNNLSERDEHLLDGLLVTEDSTWSGIAAWFWDRYTDSDREELIHFLEYGPEA